MYNLIRTTATDFSVDKKRFAQKTFSLHIVNKGFFYLCLLLTFLTFALNDAKGQNLTQANFTGVIVPQYTGSGNTTRTPTMFRATVSGLTASTTYRYYCLAALSSSFGTATSGAGIVFTVNSAGTTYQTSSTASLTTAGSYETFTTNASGSFTGWFGFVNSGNAAYTAGNTIYPVITIGNTSGTIQFRYALDLGLTVLAFSASSGANNGSFIRDTVANATAKNIVALYDTTVSNARRPLSVTCVEATGVTIGSVISGYKTNAGGWNAIMPNGTSGFQLKRIEQYSVSTGSSVCAAVKYSGNFTSTSTGTGTTAKDISASSSSVTPSVSAAITTGSQTSCSGTTIGFTATPTNGGSSPIYQWKLNNANAGANATTYSGSSFANNDAVYVVMSPDSVCASTQTPQSSTITLTVNANIAASVSASVDDNTPVVGQTINFTATPTNGGTPTYQWYKNSNPINGATSATYSTNSNYADGDVFFVRMTSTATCASPTTSQSANITITIDISGCTGTPPTATPVASSATVCNGNSSNLSLTGLGSATGYTFQWQTSTSQNGTYSDVTGETNATYAVTNITSSSWYRCVVTCSNSSISTNSNATQISVAAYVTPSVSISSSQTPSCANTSVTYTATPVNGGSSPTYAWYLNSNLVTGVTGGTYTSSTFADGDIIYTVMTSNYACLTTNTATSSNALQNVTANVAASVAISSNANPACAGSTVTFTATPTNGGTPSYQWYNGASAINGATNSTYSSASLTNNASITVVMTSSVTCVTGSPATSNAVVQGITTNVTPSLTIASNNNPVCISGNATFNINPVNAGSTPTYAWFLNGNLVSGQTGSTYTLSPVTDQDSVYATMVSSATCVTTANATSNVIHESVVSQATPSVSIAASPSTTINDGTNITFTATPTFGGASPSYQWKLNGTNVGTNSATYSSTTLLHNDVVTCVLTSNYTCLTTNTATSNSLTITILGNAPFTPGNLIVYRAGDSVNTLVTNAMPIFLAEYTTTGNFVQAKRISKNTTGVNSIYCSGSSTSEGMLTLNTNGTNLVVPGYYTSLNTASITTSSSASINRVAALVDVNQNVDTTTRLSDWATGGSPRGATASGTSIYVTGSTGGTRYAVKGATTSTQLSTSITNMRNVNIFNGQLYASDNSGTTFKLSTIGTGLPTTSGQTMTNLNGFPTASTSQPYAFFFADLSSNVAGLDVVYVADDASNTITKYSLVGSTWTSNGTVTATTVKGLTASISGSTVTLYSSATVSAPVGTYIYKFTDASGYNGAISGTVTKLVDRTGVSLMAFRGIAFAPTAFTAQPSNTTVCSDATTSLSVAMTTGTSASIYSYQWQASPDGTNWGNISNSSSYNNVTTATLSINNPTGLNGIKYRCVVTYMGAITMISNTATLTVITTVTPSVIISTTSDTVCTGNSVTFNAIGTNAGSSPVYQWKKNGNNVASGSSITFSPNTLLNGDVISCVLTANNPCQTIATVNSNSITLVVRQSPTVATIASQYSSSTTAFTMCTLGGTITLYPSISGGVWGSSNAASASVARINNVTSSANVTAIANGTTNISYTLTTPNTTCTATSTIAVTVNQEPTPNSISGVSGLCIGNTTTFTTTSTGGVWSANGRVNINSTSGFATAINSGTTVIKYTKTNANGCSASSTLNFTVNALPATPTFGIVPGTPGLTGTGGYCKNKTFSLFGSPVGGVWSSTGAFSITNAGVVTTAAAPGLGSVTYTYTNSNNCTSSRTISASVVTCGSKGINNNFAMSNEQLAIYPNPAHTSININVKILMGSGSIVITDLYGKNIKQQPLSMGTNTIDVSSFAKGMYLVSVITESGKQTQKVIVE